MEISKRYIKTSEEKLTKDIKIDTRKSLKRYLKYCEYSDRPNIIITFQ